MNICDKITIIIVSYKSEKLISKNIEILKKFPTVIVDNSKSNKLNHIIKEYKNIKLIIPDKNLGYGKGNNLGVTYSSTQYILIANPDVILDEKSILELYSGIFRKYRKCWNFRSIFIRSKDDKKN
jgi:GT2 family glycosyltransferase